MVMGGPEDSVERGLRSELSGLVDEFNGRNGVLYDLLRELRLVSPYDVPRLYYYRISPVRSSGQEIRMLTIDNTNYGSPKYWHLLNGVQGVYESWKDDHFPIETTESHPVPVFEYDPNGINEGSEVVGIVRAHLRTQGHLYIDTFGSKRNLGSVVSRKNPEYWREFGGEVRGSFMPANVWGVKIEHLPMVGGMGISSGGHVDVQTLCEFTEGFKNSPIWFYQDFALQIAQQFEWLREE